MTYPFRFIVLQDVVRLVVNGSAGRTPFTMAASATMRNEN